MTLFHFLNCCALTLAPYFVTYKYSGLSEYCSVWKCAQGSAAYFLTQLVKLTVLATFFPTLEHEGERFDAISEFMKCTVDFADLIGLYLVISKSLSGKGEIRFLAAGLGWASADCVSTRLLPFWVGARGLGFDWQYIQISLESNFNLVHYMSIATLVWLWNRYDVPQTARNAGMVLLVYAAYRNFIFEVLVNVIQLSSWYLLGVKMLLTADIGISAVLLYGTLSHRENSSR